MTTTKFETWLRDWLADTPDPIHRIETFEEAGMLTRDRGLVVHFEDGSEIQLTLVQSSRARNGRGLDTKPGEPTADDDDGSWEAAARINGIR